MDISKCLGTGCPLKETCYRYIAPEDEMQSWVLGVPFKNGECKLYWKIKIEKNGRQKA